MATEEKLKEKSRRERRKEARLTKNRKKFDSWVQHQQSLKLKESTRNQASAVETSEHKDDFGEPQESSPMQLQTVEKSDIGEVCDKPNRSKKLKIKEDLKSQKSSKKSLKSNFLRMETEGRVPSAKEDLMIERRLAKKLKVNNGRLRASADDGLHELLDGMPSVLDSLGETKEVKESVEDDAVPEDNIEDDFLDDLGEEVSADNEDDELDSVASSAEDDNFEEAISLKYSNTRKRKKTKFEEFLENDIDSVKNSAEADLALERKLAKKLKAKAGKLGGDDDEINILLEGLPSVFDSEGEPEEKAKVRVISNIEAPGRSEPSSEMALRNAPNAGSGKYVVPRLKSLKGNESTEYAQFRIQVKGLLNRLSETNVESVTGEISTLFHVSY